MKCSVDSHQALKASGAWRLNTIPLTGYTDARPALMYCRGYVLELRNCICGSTLAVVVDAGLECEAA